MSRPAAAEAPPTLHSHPHLDLFYTSLGPSMTPAMSPPAPARVCFQIAVLHSLCYHYQDIRTKEDLYSQEKQVCVTKTKLDVMLANAGWTMRSKAPAAEAAPVSPLTCPCELSTTKCAPTSLDPRRTAHPLMAPPLPRAPSPPPSLQMLRPWKPSTSTLALPSQ